MATMTRRAILRFLSLAPALALPGDLARARAESVPSGASVAQEPSWASEWPPTALPGRLAKLARAEDPCPRCGGRHECLTKDCLPVLWCADRHGAPMQMGSYEMVAPPDGLHVMECSLARRDHEFRYAVVRLGRSEGGPMA